MSTASNHIFWKINPYFFPLRNESEIENILINKTVDIFCVILLKWHKAVEWTDWNIQHVFTSCLLNYSTRDMKAFLKLVSIVTHNQWISLLLYIYHYRGSLIQIASLRNQYKRPKGLSLVTWKAVNFYQSTLLTWNSVFINQRNKQLKFKIHYSCTLFEKRHF